MSSRDTFTTSYSIADLADRKAKAEFGESVASKLKLSPDGTKVLWPQPTDDPEDPQNVLRSLIYTAKPTHMP